jgi:hypothetical protein
MFHGLAAVPLSVAKVQAGIFVQVTVLSSRLGKGRSPLPVAAN